jgi:hypothetical protein
MFTDDDREKLIHIHTLVLEMHPEVKENTRMRHRLGGIVTGVGLACATLGSFVSWVLGQIKGH